MTPDRMSGLRLRTAVVADGAEICAVYLASRPELHSDEATLRWIVNDLLLTSVVRIAEADGRIAGFLALKSEEIDQLYVHPDYYRRGVGRQLRSEARALSPERLHLFTFQRNSRARAFYEAHGFVATEFNDGSRNEEREPDVKYVWTSIAAPRP